MAVTPVGRLLNFPLVPGSLSDPQDLLPFISNLLGTTLRPTFAIFTANRNFASYIANEAEEMEKWF